MRPHFRRVSYAANTRAGNRIARDGCDHTFARDTVATAIRAGNEVSSVDGLNAARHYSSGMVGTFDDRGPCRWCSVAVG